MSPCRPWSLLLRKDKDFVRDTLQAADAPWHQVSLADTAYRARGHLSTDVHLGRAHLHVLGPQITVQPQQDRGQRRHGPRAPPHWQN